MAAVAVAVGGLVDVVGVDGAVVDGVDELGVVDDGDDETVGVELLVCVVEHWLLASAETVAAPCPRFETSFWLTPAGRSEMTFVSLREAAFAFAQSPAWTAADTDVSCPAIELL